MMVAHVAMTECQTPAILQRESSKAKQLLRLYSDSCPPAFRGWSLVVHSHVGVTPGEGTQIERACVVAHFRHDLRYVFEHICECLV
jgi:hypothetical protein